MQLSQEGRRVLGCLVEKALTTPNQYPLSRNALTNACNQSTGRDPVVDWDESRIREGIADLKDHDLVGSGYVGGSRVPKYQHRLGEHLDLGTDQQAVLALLLLRGPQTVGELRGRSSRLHSFDELEEVEGVLRSLESHRFGTMVMALPRQPGQKEVRWTHLLAAPAEAAPTPAVEVPGADVPEPREVASVVAPPTAFPTESADERLETLELRVDAMEEQLAEALDRLDELLGR